MAYANADKYLEVTRSPFPRVITREMGEKTLAAIGGAPVLPRLTPLSFNTSTGKWNVWTSGGANSTGVIKGFLWTDQLDAGLQTDAALDTLVTVILKGEIHRDDIPLPTGETQPNLDASLRTDPRLVGITIRGLDGVH